ncbi:MAG: BatD family protein [Verrucomicrobiales bacterium]|nr:BatD family protein [Verrucomicrobiales bacterium]
MLQQLTRLFLIALLLFPAGGTASAQQAENGFGISINALSSRVAIGEIGTLIVKISGGDSRLPESLDVPGLEIEHSGQQSRINIINGARTIEMTHFYRFRGDTPGNYTIPPIEIGLGTETFATKPLEITIYERDQDEAIDATKPYFGKFELSKEEFYVNEIVPLTLTSFVQGRNRIQDVLPPKLEHESFIVKSFRDVQTDGADLGNTYYSSASMPSNLFALKAGEHRLGPATLGVRVADSSGSSFGFGGFFSRTVTREMATNTVNVTVKPLPNGAPPSFTGGVGKFDLVANASTNEVSIGDPISMEFVVAGEGNFQTMSAPVFKVLPTGIWKSYEASKTMDESASTGGSSSSVGRAVFSQVIIPEAKVDTIPPFELTYFDPAREEYITLETPEIPITVSADSHNEAPTTIAYPAGGNEAAPLETASKPIAQFDDVLHIRTTTPRWMASTDLEKNPIWFYLLQTLLSAGFFTILGAGIVRWFREREVTREGPVLSYRQSLKRIPKEGAPKREFYHAVATSIKLWEAEHPDAPAPVLEIVNRINDRCDTVLYSGTSKSDGPVSAHDVSEVLPILQKLTRK